MSQLDPVHALISHFLKIQLNIILPSTSGSSKWSLSLGFPTKTMYNPLLSPIRATCPSTSFSRFDHPNNNGRGVQIIKLLIMWFFPPFPCYLIPLRPKYSPQHPVHKSSQPKILLQCERPNFTPIQNHIQNYSSIYLNL